MPNNFTFSGTALVPRTHGLNLSWVARALSGIAVLADQQRRRPGPERHPGRAARGRQLLGHRDERVYGEELQERAQRRARARLLRARHALRVQLPARPRDRTLEIAADVFNLTNRTNFAESDRKPDLVDVPRAHRLQHELHAEEAADRRPPRVLTRQHREEERAAGIVRPPFFLAASSSQLPASSSQSLSSFQLAPVRRVTRRRVATVDWLATGQPLTTDDDCAL